MYLLQTWVGKRVNLFVSDRHDGVVEFLHEVRDGLVGQECSHCSQQQVDEDEHDCENILQTRFAEFHKRADVPEVILCHIRKEGKRGIVQNASWKQKLMRVVLKGTNK